MRVVLGLDLDNYDRTLDAAAVAALSARTIAHVVVRGSLEGPSGRALAQQQLEALRDAGISRSVYLWVYFSADDPAQMVADALAAFDAYGPACYWLDVERGNDQTAPPQREDWLRRALAALDAAGKRGGIYCNAWDWHDDLGNSTAFITRPLWLADYDGVADLTVTRAPALPWAPPWAGKQYSDQGDLAGRAVDLSVFDLDAIEGEAPMPTPAARTYDPDYGTPAYQQHADWVCSCCSAAWGMGSVGEAITPAQMQDAMTAAGLVDASVGLHDGSGAQLAAWLEATYGVQTERAYPASWDWIAERAGHGPVLIGAGHPWYHWVGVRDVYWCDDTVLLLANSADGYEGVAQTLTRERFATLGTFAAIWIKVDSPAREDEVTQAEADALRQQLADANSAYGALAHDILGPTVDQLRALAAASSRTKPRDALQADLNGIADRLADYVVA